MSRLRERLSEGPPLLLDGGLGTMLIARGLAPGEPPEAWNLERPAEVEAVHRAYVEAGSEAIHTNTFGGTPLRLGRFGLDARAAEITAAAVRLARAAGPRFVLGDVGPTGVYLPPVGEGDPAAFRASFEAQGRALAEAGADGLHVETMMDLREALLALEALRRAAPDLPVLVSMTFERKRRGFFTIMGNPLRAALEALAAAGADAAGANCSIASGDMRPLGEEALAAARLPLVLQPNAGLPLPAATGGGLRYDQDPEAFAADMAALAALGVRAVGGCCGTDPRFIAALARRLAALPRAGSPGGAAPEGAAR